jgi:membrane fusion protein (multidrug efflux system)
MKTKQILIVVTLLITGVIAFRLFANKRAINAKNNETKVKPTAIPVKVAKAKLQLLEISIVKTGQLAPFKEAKVLAMTSGILQQVRFKLGDEVKQGQVLAVADVRLLQLELQKAESNAEKLRKDLNTYTELLDGKAATQEKVNEIQKNYQDAVNQVAQCRKNMGDAAIKAPTEGIITAKQVEEGMFVSPGAEIATIVNLSRAKVQVNLTESEVYQVHVGQNVKVSTDVYPGKIFNGTISFINPQADQAHNYLTEILISNDKSSQLLSGTFVYVDLSRKTEQQVLLIPREALTQDAKNTSVYVVKKDVVVQRNIQTGNETGGLVQVISGLSAGEQVVASGQINLKDSSRIVITQ